MLQHLLKFILNVNNTGGEGIVKPSDFKLSTQGEPYNIQGSEKGTIVSYASKNNYTISVDNPTINGTSYGLLISGDCRQSSVQTYAQINLEPGDKKTCIITMMHPKLLNVLIGNCFNVIDKYIGIDMVL